MPVRNVALTDFTFLMVDASTGLGLEGLTVTGAVTKAGVQTPLSGTISEVGGGEYTIDTISNTEMDALCVGLLFTAEGALPVHFTIITESAGVNVVSINGSTAAATNLGKLMSVARSVEVDTGTFSPTVTDFETSITTDLDTFTLEAITWITGPYAGQTYKVLSYDFTNGKVKLTLDVPLPAAPSNGDEFMVFGSIR